MRQVTTQPRMHPDPISTQQPCGEFVVATNIGQALLPSLKQKCQLREVQTEQLAGRGVEIIGLDHSLSPRELIP